LGYQQRDDIEYLFTSSFTLEQDSHLFTAVKDNTHLFEDRHDIITEKDGALIFNWATNGDVKAKKAELEKAKEEAKAKIAMNEKEEAEKIVREQEEKTKEQKKSLKQLQTEILELCKDLSVKGKRDGVVAIVKELNNDDANPKNITDLEIANKVLETLKEL
jgi:hypothetical protein